MSVADKLNVTDVLVVDDAPLLIKFDDVVFVGAVVSELVASFAIFFTVPATSSVQYTFVESTAML